MVSLDHILDVRILEQFVQHLAYLFILYFYGNFTIYIDLVVIHKEILCLFLYFREYLV